MRQPELRAHRDKPAAAVGLVLLVQAVAVVQPRTVLAAVAAAADAMPGLLAAGPLAVQMRSDSRPVAFLALPADRRMGRQGPAAAVVMDTLRRRALAGLVARLAAVAAAAGLGATALARSALVVPVAAG